METETVDTGERKEMFGRPARHVITTQRVEPLAGPTREVRVSVIDGWYIQLDTRLTCDPDWWGLLGHGYLTGHTQGDPPARPMFVSIGEPERGYPLRLRTTDGDSVMDMEVTELSTAALDPSLFDVPAGFRCIEMIRQEPAPPFVVRLRQVYDRLMRPLRIGR